MDLVAMPFTPPKPPERSQSGTRHTESAEIKRLTRTNNSYPDPWIPTS